MRQLGITDAAFINIENPTVPQQIGRLGSYDPSTAHSTRADRPGSATSSKGWIILPAPAFPICCAGAHAGADTLRRALPGAGAQHHQRAGFDAVDACTAQRAL